MLSICPLFKWHSKTGPFGIQPLIDHSDTELLWYSDPHCTQVDVASECYLNFLAHYSDAIQILSLYYDKTTLSHEYWISPKMGSWL